MTNLLTSSPGLPVGVFQESYARWRCVELSTGRLIAEGHSRETALEASRLFLAKLFPLAGPGPLFHVLAYRASLKGDPWEDKLHSVPERITEGSLNPELSKFVD